MTETIPPQENINRNLIRPLQRNLLLQSFPESPDGAFQKKLTAATPSMRPLQYQWSSSIETTQDMISLQDIKELYQLCPKDHNIYEIMMGVITTAKNPNELQNSLGLLAGLVNLRTQEDVRNEAWAKQQEFLESNDRIDLKTSGEAQRLITDFVTTWSDSNETSLSSRLDELVVKHLTSGSEQFTTNAKALSEAYISVILDQKGDPEMRKAFLLMPQLFQFGDQFGVLKHTASQNDATFWENVDGTWAGLPIPELPQEPETPVPPRPESDIPQEEQVTEASPSSDEALERERARADALDTSLQEARKTINELLLKQLEPEDNSDAKEALKLFGISTDSVRSMDPQGKEQLKNSLKKIAQGVHPDFTKGFPQPVIRQMTSIQRAINYALPLLGSK